MVLLSGGLDSMLAIRVLQEQGLEVEAINFQTIFTCCKNTAAQAAHELGVPLTVIGQEDDYIELVRRPKYGYGKGANPCVDCRIYMFQQAAQVAEQLGAEVIASGEVLGQRPMSQKRRDLEIIARESGLEGRLLRPLSALLLPPTEVEQRGLVDRSRLFGFHGRNRKHLISLAQSYGFKSIPSPSSGCALTETTFAPKVYDLIQLDAESGRWDFELLNIGRHIRIDEATKAIVGRREEENIALQQRFTQPGSRASLMLVPESFRGPTVMIIGPLADEIESYADGLVARYSKDVDLTDARVYKHTPGKTTLESIAPHEQAVELCTL